MCIIFPHLHFFSHENTKDKREANPEGWDLEEEEVYGEPRRAHASIYPEPVEPAKYVWTLFSFYLPILAYCLYAEFGIYEFMKSRYWTIANTS